MKSWSFLKLLAVFPQTLPGTGFHPLPHIPTSASKLCSWEISQLNGSSQPTGHGFWPHFYTAGVEYKDISGNFICQELLSTTLSITLTTAGEQVHNVLDISTCFYNTPVKYQRPRLLGLTQNTAYPQTRLFPRKCWRI